ncbi:hypothetical protein C8Q73DRAFT_128688 [Cubamyces lactineus]|nr:hypothetical protein C8Q73DRAFT_128688 [Cubamyces lactineus]
MTALMVLMVFCYVLLSLLWWTCTVSIRISAYIHIVHKIMPVALDLYPYNRITDPPPLISASLCPLLDPTRCGTKRSIFNSSRAVSRDMCACVPRLLGYASWADNCHERVIAMSLQSMEFKATMSATAE